MGAVFGIVLGLPIALFWMILSPVIGLFTGADKAEIILPYDEASGLAWEYDDYQDVYVNLADTRIEDDKQIFTFKRNYLVLDDGNGGMAIDLIFTDKNGNSEIYYIACPNGGFGMNVLAPGEYAVYTHTAKAETPVNGGYWTREYSDSIIADFLLYQPIEKGEEAEFTVVCPLNDEYIGVQLGMSFVYTDRKYLGDDYEKEQVLYKAEENGTITVVRVIE